MPCGCETQSQPCEGECRVFLQRAIKIFCGIDRISAPQPRLPVEISTERRQRCAGEIRHARRRLSRSLGQKLRSDLIDQGSKTVRRTLDTDPCYLISLSYPKQRNREHESIRSSDNITKKCLAGFQLPCELERTFAREIVRVSAARLVPCIEHRSRLERTKILAGKFCGDQVD